MMNLKINKKIIVPALASLILLGGIGGTALAAKNGDIVKKNVLMAEKMTTSSNDASNGQVSIGNPPKSNISKVQAVDIAKKAFKTIFGVEIKDGEYKLETDYFDKEKNKQSYKGKSIWTVSWINKQIDTNKNNIQFNSAFIDAQTGEILSMTSQDTTDAKATNILSNDAAKTMVADFVQSKNLTNGAAIKEIQVTNTIPKKVIIAEVKLDNGKGLAVLISTKTNKIISWKN
ncbi:PepSY domain-containing protein [Neobacillus mesonae]|uniref:PepSY domain-containing protein n=1 Tax=Neobacillus mesonae TaxID=1193713 RepID=UPI00203FB8A0|nr:PepSY domain-containing protein [Neobacillus mesonae]MCM3571487.1 PepSY domain-containing protein [Neobacillus mesonae]